MCVAICLLSPVVYEIIFLCVVLVSFVYMSNFVRTPNFGHLLGKYSCFLCFWGVLVIGLLLFVYCLLST